MRAEGASSVVELNDPTAHAEVTALRNAGKLSGASYSKTQSCIGSSEPCPMCLVACYRPAFPD
jgi:guanine deaminase